MTVTVEGIGQKIAGEQRQRLEMLIVSVLFLRVSLYVSSCASAHSVDKECSVSKAPGFIEVIWLS